MRQVFRNPTPEANDQSHPLRSRQLPRLGRRGGGLFAPAFAAIRAANDRSVPKETLRAAFVECWRVAFDVVADKYGSDTGRRLARVPAEGRHRADVPVAERLREGGLLRFVRV